MIEGGEKEGRRAKMGGWIMTDSSNSSFEVEVTDDKEDVGNC